MHKKHSNQIALNISHYGYFVSLFGTALLLLWIGVFKFTPTEAAAIQPLILHHPLSFWMYDVFKTQTVSNIVGIIEIMVALCLLLSIRFEALKKYAAIGLVLIFLTTLSYLFTTPNMWRLVDGVPVTDFFILKDLVILGFGMSLFTTSKTN